MALESAGKVSHNHDGALENTHQQHVLTGVVLVDARRQFGDLRVNLFLAEENVLDIVLHVDSLHDVFLRILLDALRLRRGPRVRGFHAFPQRTMWMVFTLSMA